LISMDIVLQVGSKFECSVHHFVYDSVADGNGRTSPKIQ
jgi:hypothetical protein